MDYCIFYNNQNTLFHGKLEITNSFIDHFGITSSANNNSLTKTSTYRLQFFNSVYCSTDLLVIGQTPIRTNEVTLRMTLFRTQDLTIKETPLETSLKSYDEVAPSYQMIYGRKLRELFFFPFLYHIFA